MNLSIGENNFLESFEQISDQKISDKNNMYTFMINSNANQFDYKMLEENLRDTVIGYALSRSVSKFYKNRPVTLVHKAKEKFIEYRKNDGELGELLLYCFLETHLKAPKILSKLELKTTNKKYVNGSDGVHYLKLNDGNYQLIFGESKMYESLSDAIGEALKSIKEFKEEINKKGEKKSGICFEKSLISDNLMKEFKEEDEAFIRSLIYPTSKNDFYVDDAFGIFIGYQIEISACDKKLGNIEFRNKMKEKIVEEMEKCSVNINKKIETFGLEGHNFYLYIVPFTNINEKRKEILGEILN